jgi:hypothetical protein
MAHEEQLTSDAIVERVNTYGVNLTGSYIFFIGEPSVIQLSYSEYHSLKTNCVDWSTHTGKYNSFNTFSDIISSGIIIVNKGNSISHKDYSGNYVYVTDNTGLNSTDDYKKIHNIKSYRSLTNQQYVSSYETLTDSNTNFAITATNQQGSRGSLSEVVYSVNDSDICKSEFNDVVNVGHFKLAQTAQSSDVRYLNYQLIENHSGSMNFYSKQSSPVGGLPLSDYIESIANENSNKLEVFVNPYLSKYTTSWDTDTGDTSVYIRVYDYNISYISQDEDDTLTQYVTSMSGQNVLPPSKNLYNFSKYSPRLKYTANVGNVPQKLKTAFEQIDNDELNHYDIIVEAGLGTIFAASAPQDLDSDGIRVGGIYTEDKYVEMSELYSNQDKSGEKIVTDYTAVSNEILNLANKGKKSLAILDPLRSIFIQGNDNKILDDQTKYFGLHTYWPLKHQFSSINTSYAATYANWLKVYDSSINSQLWIPSSGHMAGQLLLSEQLTYPWDPVGGRKKGILTQVNDIALKPTDKEEGQLYKINLNPIKYTPTDGFVINGQKTLQTKPTAFDRINVRRTFLYLEKIVKDTLKYFIFKPNSLHTRIQIVNTITPIFELAKTSNPQGVYDYKIVCDKSNNSSEVIDRNELIVDIFIQPVRSAEFILVNFHATRSGQDFQEIIQ